MKPLGRKYSQLISIKFDVTVFVSYQYLGQMYTEKVGQTGII